MAKVIKFPGAVPEKFGLQRARKVKEKKADKHGQLNLFTGGKVVRLSKLTPFEEALFMEEQGDTNAAMNLYKKAIEQKDSHADAYCNLGIIEFENSLYPKAIDSFTNCLKLEPRHFEAHYNLANLYAEVGETKLAKFHYEVSIEIEPTFPNSYFNLGLTHAMNKEYAEAVRVLYQYRELTIEEDHKQVDALIFTLQRTGG
jgi:tetratricopeptide (TPR) repeat protein